jgi:hypothetical protein
MSSTVSINKHYFDQWTDDMYKYLISFNQIKRGTSSHFPETEGKNIYVLREIKKIRAMYLYLNRTILKVYTFNPKYQRLYKTFINKRDELIQDIKYKNIDPKYIQTCLITLNKFGKFENCDILNYKYFILFIFKKMRICYDLSRFICTFI